MRKLVFIMSIFIVGQNSRIFGLNINNIEFFYSNYSNEMVVSIAHATATTLIGINNLSKEDYCTFTTTLDDSAMSSTDKYTALGSTSGLLALRNSVDNLATILRDNYNGEMFSDPSAKDLFMRTALPDLQYDLPTWDGIVNGGPCGVYKSATSENFSQLWDCIGDGSVGCLPTGLLGWEGYVACCGGVILTCGRQFDRRQASINKGNPGCVGTFQFLTSWKNWMLEPEETGYENPCSN